MSTHVSLTADNQKGQRCFHFIGIGGIGMSGLARILLQKGGIRVSGSDLKWGGVLDQLQILGATVSQGHRKENLPAEATVVVSTDIQEDNPELQEAKARHYPVIHRSDVLLELMQGKDVLAVTGTHGKTTTTSLLTHVLTEAGVDPTYAVGGILRNCGTNANYGVGRFFVAEADESDGTFLKYPYAYGIVTNIDSDHLAHFGSIEALEAAFGAFLQKAPHCDRVLYCGDDKRLRHLNPQGISYGFSEGCDARILSMRPYDGGSCSCVEFRGVRYGEIVLPLMGRHNVLNGTAVFCLAIQLGIAEEAIRKAFASFLGTKRRLEKKDAGSGCLVFDDYAHHPTEIRATLAALRQAVGARRIIAVYQPHRPSRMKRVLHEFDGAFVDADVIVLTELYLSNESAEGISNKQIVETIAAGNGFRSLHVYPRTRLVEELQTIVQRDDVLIFLGAGDITKASDECAGCLKCKRW